jgi:hypothetical protein
MKTPNHIVSKRLALASIAIILGISIEILYAHNPLNPISWFSGYLLIDMYVSQILPSSISSNYIGNISNIVYPLTLGLFTYCVAYQKIVVRSISILVMVLFLVQNYLLIINFT